MARTIPRGRAAMIRVLALALLAFLWGAHTTGLISSNDGSHLALARAFALRGETRIDPEMGMTLRVDLAERGGHFYSDRPPGTAALAAPAAWVGARFDAGLLTRSREARRMLVRPATDPYILTYAARSPGAPPLAGYMGTSLALGVHTTLLGVLGAALMLVVLRRREVGLGAQLLALSALGLGSLWGPYATALFSHVSAGTALIGLWLALEVLEQEELAPRRAALVGIGAGVAGATAIACDYLLLVAVVPLVLLASSPRRWPWVLCGALPVAGLVSGYHAAAFGHPLAVGYDFQTNFDFARARGSTFGGDPLQGAWTLLGAGRGGAGLLVQGPALLVGLGLGLAAPAWAPHDPSRPITGRARWMVLGLSPWLLLLCLHQTPWGGAGEDHRYLVPALPLLAIWVGVAAHRWLQARRAVVLALAGAAGLPALWIWPRFLAWHEGSLFPRPALGVALALWVIALGAAFAALRRGRNVEGAGETW